MAHAPGGIRSPPPWEPVDVIEAASEISDGSRVVLKVRLGPLRKRWIAEHRGIVPSRQFRDVQIEGPFAYWEYTHRIESVDTAGCTLEDHVRYTVPLGWLGRAVAGRLARHKLEQLFDYRHRVTRQDVAAHMACRERKSMNVLVTGSTGLVGSAVVAFLTSGGHQVTRLVRTPPASGSAEVFWDPASQTITTPALEGVDAVVHMAGENIATGRWNAAKKSRIYDSRVKGTRLLCDALAQLVNPPKVLVSASAIGYYGDRGDRMMREDSRPGTDFLAEVCRDWEAATAPAAERGIRVVQLRIGVVMTPAGGALHKMLTPFKLGGGGVIGNGQQYMSWVALDDVVGMVHHALMTESLHGPVNAVAPNPVTNHEFTKTLGRVLKRPTLFPLPAPAAKALFGEMADALMLSSTRVDAGRISESGYTFRFPELEGALRHLLGKAPAA